ncbi:DUF262 domain-containing HNH endonuclease family protein [Asticcacaulis sp. DXS10W]|uniref:DUF262 domain-containing HNH endonuclease family protein n=1 Tax=Asticcacaulis currens TaxID=2984210 RepID=A0ABT5IF54_9CAUL|nr:DUF262 domain-containing HNH endonuclease family protein [Asticcacaulis currens]MDC7694816.1 DUF262 domain-containing HNH endonuclease family protein [Asticcacaulis currens]
MADDKGFEFESVGLASVLAGNVLQIPPHQRDYAWTADKVQQLFSDLATAKDSNLDYFLGTIVTIKKGDQKPLDVVDGQQRLTTTYLMICAIRDYLVKIDRGNDAVRNIEGTILNTIDRRTGDRPRLTLNTDDREFFRALTKKSVNLNELKPTRDSHDLLLEAAKLAAKWVTKVTAITDINSVPDVLNRWLDYLEQDAQVVLLKASNGARAFKMFETLNDRGLRTSQADLVKSYLFGEAGEHLDEAQVCWSTMLENLQEIEDDEKSLTFLRHLVIATKKFVRADEIYQVIQDSVRGQSASITFLNEIKRHSATYVATFRPHSDHWSTYPPAVRRALEAFNFFDLKPMRPLIFAVAERFPPQEAVSAISFMLSLSVRLVIAAQTRTGSNEQAFASAALKVFAREIETSNALKSALSKVVISDAEFEQEFSTAKVSNAKLARYYLRTLEASSAGEAEPQFVVNWDETAITLEHVFPKSPSDNEWLDFREDNRRLYKTRLGNLCLLQMTTNSTMPNDSYAAKRPFLKQSGYKLTQSIAQNEKWSPDEIEARQREMAKLAVKAWPI